MISLSMGFLLTNYHKALQLSFFNWTIAMWSQWLWSYTPNLRSNFLELLYQLEVCGVLDFLAIHSLQAVEVGIQMICQLTDDIVVLSHVSGYSKEQKNAWGAIKASFCRPSWGQLTVQVCNKALEILRNWFICRVWHISSISPFPQLFHEA